LEDSYSAMRMSHEMTSLLSLDLLHGGGTVLQYMSLFRKECC
jgi:hypothetical protein